MWADKLLDAVLERRYTKEWPEKFRAGFEELFGAASGRYPDAARRVVTLRAPAPAEANEGFVPFAALIHPSNPNSGSYGGTSMAIFPGNDAECLITFVVGTNGLAPDEQILGRPGHARKVSALCAWLNKKHGKLVAWAKHDPTRLDQRVPSEVAAQFEPYSGAISRYGHVLYAIYAPSFSRDETLEALTAFLDLLFDERGFRPLSRWESHAADIRAKWFRHLMPETSKEEVADLLEARR